MWKVCSWKEFKSKLNANSLAKLERFQKVQKSLSDYRKKYKINRIKLVK